MKIFEFFAGTCANGRAGRIAVSVERTVYRGTGEQRGWEIQVSGSVKRRRIYEPSQNAGSPTFWIEKDSRQGEEAAIKREEAIKRGEGRAGEQESRRTEDRRRRTE